MSKLGQKRAPSTVKLWSSQPRDIEELAEVALKFRDRLDSMKRSIRSPEFDWYPYNTFAVFPVLNSMLRENRRDLLTLAGVAPVLDIGCGDGDLSFFFESVGCRVTAIDNSETNYNRMLGFKALGTAVGSSVDLEMCDLDAGLDLRGRTFGLVVCLGVLYHLKNPFGLLETLAQHARHCLLSTRVAQTTVRGTPIADEPVAYLLDRTEANNDPTNYWIFSEAGLRRILDRTGWDLCDYATTGVQHASDPAHRDRDQRAFCMLRSKLADPWLEVDLEGGWHAMEHGSWRWTEREFAVRLTPTASERATLRFQFRLPDATIQSVGAIRLRAAVGGVYLPVCEYNTPGEHVYTQEIPPAALTRDSISIRFELDKAYGPTAADHRQLGVQVAFWSYTDSTPLALCPITVSQ